ncbi:MAG: error-prone DNA polymerase [Planctomycetota bacterium]|nr:error-prone DNA polymerase [Planctomycetota bacterium]
MPEAPISSKRRPTRAAAGNSSSTPAFSYAELHCRTNFSFLEGASHPDELVSRAIELGYSALAITDRHSLAGIVRAHAAAKDSDLKLLIGAEIVPVDGSRVVLLATDRAAYGRLARLLTLGRRRAPKGECELTIEDIAQHSSGLLAVQSSHHAPRDEPSSNDSSIANDLHQFQLQQNRLITAERDGYNYRDIFADRCYLLAELHYGTNDAERLDQLIRLSKQTGLPLVAAGDVHYHVPQRMMLQHVLAAIRHGTTVEALGDRLLPNAERHLRTLDEIQQVFARVPDAVRRTMELADRCTFSLNELRYEYPVELAPVGQTPLEYLRQLTWQGACQRYNDNVPDSIKQQLEHELAIIKDLRYEAFFLTVYDIVQFARSRNILCQGRGSAANSSVCFCLGITAVDPTETDLLFERFVSRERNEAPDIDVDFEHERREEVLQYVYNKYGRDRAGLAATVITYRPRSAIRDVGKALGLSLDRSDALAKNIDGRSEETVLAKRCQQSGIDPRSRVGRQLMTLVNEVLGFPRHLSQHVGGMVITQGPLCELVPIENAAMVDRTVIQWDKDDLDELGILKVDCLALGMLTAIHRCFDLVERHHGRRLTIANTPQDDRAVYEMICRAETIGVFQIESRAQMSMLPRLRPERFYDIVIEVAIVRPGPIQGDMVHPYLDRRDRARSGEQIEPICADDKVNKVLERTLGVPLFQEQAMQLAVVAAGFTPGEADQLRKAMGGWRRPGLIDSFRQKFFEGMLEHGHTEEFAERLFKQISGFGEYGFPESHAASFARLAYVSAWLRYHYQAAFTAALINSQPMGFYAPAQLIRDARERRDTPVEVRPLDVNHSDWDCTLEDGGKALRLGLRLVRGLARAAVDALVQARTTPFDSVADLVARTQLGQAVIERLTAADAFQSLGLDRRTALWQALDQAPKHESGPRLFNLQTSDTLVPLLPKLHEQEEVFADYRSSGLSLRRHPLSFHREQLNAVGVTPAGQLVNYPHERMVKVAGVVLMRQRPSTAKGITFVTLEDETGIANLVVHQATWQRYDLIARKSTAMIASGKLERKNEVVHVIARRLEDLTDRLASLHSPSRDFR